MDTGYDICFAFIFLGDILEMDTLYLLLISRIDFFTGRLAVSRILFHSTHCTGRRIIKSIPFIVVQNGLRHPFEGSSGTFHVQHYFSFGENEKKYFPKQNMEVENYYPAGSLINSIFSTKNTEDQKGQVGAVIPSIPLTNIFLPGLLCAPQFVPRRKLFG